MFHHARGRMRVLHCHLEEDALSDSASLSLAGL